VLVAIAAPRGTPREIAAVRSLLDRFFADWEARNVRSIRKVADTLFPIDFYCRSRGPAARNHLYRMQCLASRVERRCIPCGTYFDRLIDWPSGKGPKGEPERNQLERCIQLLKTYYDRGTRNLSATELAVTCGHSERELLPEDASTDLRVRDPMVDKRIIGFPCLSHVSVTLHEGRINLTAMYRSQHFLSKAYGNYVGLADLQAFIAAEVSAEVGELVCVAANAALGLTKGIGKREIRTLLDCCRAAALDAGGYRPV
jgi:hypothetical protein